MSAPPAPPSPSPLPPAFNKPADLPPAFSKPAEEKSSWAFATLPDGRQVEDRPSSKDPGGGNPVPLVWRTEGAKLQRSMLPKLAALLGALMAIVAYYLGRLMDLDVVTYGTIALVVFLVGFGVFYFVLGRMLRAQMSGEGGLSMMYLPIPLATPEQAGAIVSAAAATLGRTANAPKRLGRVTYWDLDVPIRFYFNPMMGPALTFLSIKTAKRDQLDLYLRLKGQILAQLLPPQPPA